MNEEHERIRELMDACRPDHDDLAAPEFQLLAERIEGDARLRRTFDRSQQWDRAVTGALQDVDVPTGLADRLLAALDPNEPPNVASRGRGGRWWLIRAAGVCGIAAAVIIAVVWRSPGPDALSPTRLAEKSLQWIERMGGEEDSWQMLKAHAAVRTGHPPRLPRTARLKARKWRPIPGSPAVCYGLQTADGRAPAYLIVLPNPGSASFPTSPTLALRTAGRCVAVWKSRDNRFLYALVVVGSEERYRRLVPTPRTA